MLDFEVHYPSGFIFAQLVREILVGRYYDLPLESVEPVIFDCGANIGMATLFFKHRWPASRVKAFEPSPEAYSLLSRNLEENGLTGVEAHNVALTDEDGTIELWIDEAEPAGLTTAIVPSPGRKAIPVAARRLSSFMDDQVDLLKLDVEGAEGPILSELAASGALDRVRCIVCEYHHNRDQSGDGLGRFLSTLEDHGFQYQLLAYAQTPVLTPVSQEVMITAYRR